MTGDATVAMLLRLQKEKIKYTEDEYVNIYLEANPNPNSLKFVADRMLLDDKVIKEYPDQKALTHKLQESCSNLITLKEYL